MSEAIEALAEAWASLDGKLDEFLAGRAGEANQPLTADDVRKLVHGDEEQEEPSQPPTAKRQKGEPASDSEECAPTTGP
jgi:hypothetical protein